MANFEDRLTALSSPETVKKAKALLKQKQLAGAWRNRHGQLCGILKENPLPPAEVAVTTGETLPQYVPAAITAHTSVIMPWRC